jgi:hypothetical protein
MTSERLASNAASSDGYCTAAAKVTMHITATPFNVRHKSPIERYGGDHHRVVVGWRFIILQSCLANPC